MIFIPSFLSRTADGFHHKLKVCPSNAEHSTGCRRQSRKHTISIQQHVLTSICRPPGGCSKLVPRSSYHHASLVTEKKAVLVPVSFSVWFTVQTSANGRVQAVFKQVGIISLNCSLEECTTVHCFPYQHLPCQRWFPGSPAPCPVQLSAAGAPAQTPVPSGSCLDGGIPVRLWARQAAASWTRPCLSLMKFYQSNRTSLDPHQFVNHTSALTPSNLLWVKVHISCWHCVVFYVCVG